MAWLAPVAWLARFAWLAPVARVGRVAWLTTGNPSEQYGIDTIDALSKATWQNMAATVAN